MQDRVTLDLQREPDDRANRELQARQLWTDTLRETLLREHGMSHYLMRRALSLSSHLGSILSIPDIPDELKAVFATAWELPQRAILDMAIARGPFIDQSQSTTLYMRTPDQDKLVRACLAHTTASSR